MDEEKIYPYILCGGSGSRLWPLSRRSYPKQFLSLVSDKSLLQETCLRLQHRRFESPAILTGENHRFLVAEQLRLIDVDPKSIVLEPVGRNTAPAALIAALMGVIENPDAQILLLPSDHVIRDNDGFNESIFTGAVAAAAGHIVTFGVKPEHPTSGYGYIETEYSGTRVLDVKNFIEKPSIELAKKLVVQENFFWNAGIFLFKAQKMIDAFESYLPETLAACRASLALSTRDLDFIRLDRDTYCKAENISLDYAIMEKAQYIKTVPLASDWNDLGSWPAVWSMHEKDKNGNVSQGDVFLMDTFNSFAHSKDGIQLSLIGLDNMFAVVTKDAVIVAPKSRAQDVKSVVDEFSDQNRAEVDLHRRVYRPWGWYEGLGQGDRYQVKCIMVKPGAKLSLQSHHHRAEHWVVVKGTLEVTLGEKINLLTENQSIYVPLGEVHRLANPGKVPAFMVEVQSGCYLGEDDIVRYDDIYGRNSID